jgi:hypothetical protein
MSGSDDAARLDAPPADASTLVVRLALAALTAAAGVVHLVMVPQHAQESTLDGIMFLLAGWAQLGLAVALLAWPRRVVLQATAVVNLACVVAWTVSRTTGLPWGAHPGVKEAAGTVDQITTLFEALAVVVALAALIRPELLRSLGDRAVLVGAAAVAAVVVAASVVLTSPEAANHSHGDAADATTPVDARLASASQRCDLGFNPASYWHEATTAGYDTVTGGSLADSTAASAASTAAAAPAAGGHSHGAAPAASAAPAAPAAPRAVPSVDDGRGSADLDRVMALSTRPGEGAEAGLVSTLARISDEDYEAWLARVSGTATHAGPQHWKAMTDQAQCDELADELQRAQDVALAHPTAKDAVEAGYTRVTGYVPGIAAHYMNFGYVDDEFELEKPEMLLYDGTDDGSAIVGLSYYITMGAEIEPTQGFTGDEDAYHVHAGLCVSGAGVIGDSTTTDEECAERGGRKPLGSGNWMSHAWVVPGCESPWGVFSGNNPLLDVSLGRATGTDGGSCAGSGVLDRYDLEPGTEANTPTTVTGSGSASDVQVASSP